MELSFLEKTVFKWNVLSWKQNGDTGIDLYAIYKNLYEYLIYFLSSIFIVQSWQQIGYWFTVLVPMHKQICTKFPQRQYQLLISLVGFIQNKLIA